MDMQQALQQALRYLESGPPQKCMELCLLDQTGEIRTEKFHLEKG